MRLFLGNHADALPGHDRAVLYIAVDDRAAQRSGPEMLDLQLRRFFGQFAVVESHDDFALLCRRNRRLASLARARTGITGKRGSSWIDGTASRAAARMKACLNFGCAMDSSRRQNACRAARPTRPFRDRMLSPRRGRCHRRRTPARRGFPAKFPAPAPRC